MNEQDLLANLLYATSYGRQGEEMAHRLIRHFGSLKHVLGSDKAALTRLGLSEAQAALLLAVHPVARRCALAELDSSPDLSDPRTLREYVRALFIGACNERFIVISLDRKGRLMDARTVSEGTMREIPLLPRTLLSCVMRSDAASVIFTHNHPGGQARFSSADIRSTRIFANYLRSTGIALWDHVLYADGEIVSMRQTCRVPEIFAEPPR